MTTRPGQKLVGFGVRIERLGHRRNIDPGDIYWISEAEYWELKNQWPDRIYDLTSKSEPFVKRYFHD